MKERKTRRGILLGLLLCAATLALAVALQRAGYLTYLNSDMASETILARRQVDTGSLVQMDWLYSTEIHTVHMNLFYALAFLVTPSFETARIIGNMIGFLLGMAALVWLCRALRLSWGAALCTAALLPLAASTSYAANMTVGGYYIIHLSIGFAAVALWLPGKGRGTGRAIAFALLCFAMGFLSVRYVLCFACPMLAAAALDAIFARGDSPALAQRVRFAAWTAAGFAACALGFAASQVILPRLFVSGVGGASSFAFNPLDGPAVMQTLFTVAGDLLKLLGWRGGAPLFSAAGIVNLCVAGVVFLGPALLAHALRGARETAGASQGRRMMLLYACAALMINLFCFVFIEGAYLPRYLILAVMFFVPALPVALALEDNVRLKAAFLAVLLAGLSLSAGVLLRETRAAETDARQRDERMMEAVAALKGAGYTHGYGTFWNVRVMQERSQGALTFTGVAPSRTEEGAIVPCAPEFIRWLEPDGASALDACPGETFLLLTREEAAELEDWLALTGAKTVFENGEYVAFGFASSQAFVTDALLGKATLEAGDRVETGDGGLEAIDLGPQGRLRVPPSTREAGRYALRFVCDGEPAQDAVVRAYTGRDFELFAEQRVTAGENVLHFALGESDKYFMLQILSGEGSLRVTDVRLEKAGN